MGQVLDEIEGSSQKVNSFFVSKNAKEYVEIVWDRQGGVPMREVPQRGTSSHGVGGTTERVTTEPGQESQKPPSYVSFERTSGEQPRCHLGRKTKC